MPEAHLRAADSDRAAVAAVLGRHMADGRLTVDEYDERLSRAYAARTYGELDAADGRPPVDPPSPGGPAGRARRPLPGPGVRPHVRALARGRVHRRRLAVLAAHRADRRHHLGRRLDRQHLAPLLLADLGHRPLGCHPPGADAGRRTGRPPRSPPSELRLSRGAPVGIALSGSGPASTRVATASETSASKAATSRSGSGTTDRSVPKPTVTVPA